MTSAVSSGTLSSQVLGAWVFVDSFYVELRNKHGFLCIS